jgi:hypothetical protein
MTTCRMELLQTMTLADFAYLRHSEPEEVASDEQPPPASVSPLGIARVPDYAVGWTDVTDEDGDGLQWEAAGFSNLEAAIKHANQLAIANPSWRFIVIDDDEVNFDVLWESSRP